MTIAQNAQFLFNNQSNSVAMTDAGWKFIGSGAYRRSWLGPDGKVYKIQHDSDAWAGEPSENETEWRNYMLYAKKISRSKIVRLARCWGYDPKTNVICMEFVPNEGDAWEFDEWNINPANDEARAAEKILTALDIYDFGPGNGWMYNGKVVLVDYAQ